MKLSTQADYLPVSEYMSMLQKIAAQHGRMPDWVEDVPKGGYYHVALRHRDWSGAHEWARAVCGVDHYSWAGHNFFFTYEKDAQLFRLCFGV